MWKLAMKLAVCSLITCFAMHAQPSVHSVDKHLLTAVVAVAGQYPKAVIIAPANERVLAEVHTICVLPSDGFTAQTVVGALPDLSPVVKQLSDSKQLRQQRYEVAAELETRGFSVFDCVTMQSPNTPRLLITSLQGGGFDSDFPTIYWTLYAGEDHVILNKGERELMGLARPAYGTYPLHADGLAMQVNAVVNAARSAEHMNGQSSTPPATAIPQVTESNKTITVRGCQIKYNNLRNSMAAMNARLPGSSMYTDRYEKATGVIQQLQFTSPTLAATFAKSCDEQTLDDLDKQIVSEKLYLAGGH